MLGKPEGLNCMSSQGSLECKRFEAWEGRELWEVWAARWIFLLLQKVIWKIWTPSHSYLMTGSGACLPDSCSRTVPSSSLQRNLIPKPLGWNTVDGSGPLFSCLIQSGTILNPYLLRALELGQPVREDLSAGSSLSNRTLVDFWNWGCYLGVPIDQSARGTKRKY